MNQANSTELIQDRAKVLRCWIAELKRKNIELTEEITANKELIHQLLRASNTVDFISNINRDTKNVRNTRLLPDLIQDDLSDEINKEEAMCIKAINLNSHYVTEVEKQIKELMDAKLKTEYDWSDKKSAYDIDTACLNVKNSSTTNQRNPVSTQLPDKQSSMTDHANYIKETLTFAQATLTRSRVLRKCVKDIINKSAKDLQRQADCIDLALVKSIEKTFTSCKRLERSMDACLKSLAHTETTIRKINDNVKKFDAPMKCAQTRLNMRSEREGIENCCDVSQATLIDEIRTISESVTSLLNHAKDAEKAMDALTASRKKLETDIRVKQKTLWVHNDRCKLIRSFYPTEHTLCGYLTKPNEK